MQTLLQLGEILGPSEIMCDPKDGIIKLKKGNFVKVPFPPTSSSIEPIPQHLERLHPYPLCAPIQLYIKKEWKWM
jgi:hypothetical protein